MLCDILKWFCIKPGFASNFCIKEISVTSPNDQAYRATRIIAFIHIWVIRDSCDLYFIKTQRTSIFDLLTKKTLLWFQRTSFWFFNCVLFSFVFGLFSQGGFYIDYSNIWYVGCSIKITHVVGCWIGIAMITLWNEPYKHNVPAIASNNILS